MSAEEFKAKGNEALKAKNPSLAIQHYTSAINIDGSNHVYYSNRSAAYLSKGDAMNALEDAESCVNLNPEFSKGYSRKGAALHYLKRYNDAIAFYEEALVKFPGDRGLVSGLESVKKDKDAPPAGMGMGMGGMGMGGMGGMGGANSNPMAGLFGPQLMSKIALDPKLRTYMSDPDFMQKIQTIQNDPNQLGSMLNDPRMMEVFQVMLGMNGMQMKTGEEFAEEQKQKETAGAGGSAGSSCETGCCPVDTSSSTTSTTSCTKPAAKKEEPATAPTSQPTPMEVVQEPAEEEDLSDLTPEEREIKEKQKQAVQAKVKGNELYKAKKFTEALAAYDEAIELDPTNMTFISNKAAVYFTSKQYDECIEACQKAVEVGKEHMAPFEDRGKALTRCAKAYQKKGMLAEAIEMCKSAQLEVFDKNTQRLLKTLELEKKKADTLAYQDPEKAEESKQLGNTHFRNKEWPKAVEAYEDAVKRAPKNATIRNNLAAALCKIMDFNGAKREIEVALDLDPEYVKAWARKGDIEMVMKESHKAMESYKKGLALDPKNAACKEGLQKVTAQINYGQANMTEEEKKERAAHAMADPEIQAILQDPVITQVLKDFGENPNAANEAMMDAGVRGKIEKLIAAGVLQTG